MKFVQPQIVLCELGTTTSPGLQSYSPFCLKVHRALIVAGLAYESRHGAPASFREHNPAGQVPVLLVDDEAFTDSTRILEKVHQIALTTGGTALVPAAATARAEAWLWEDYADRALSGYVVAARWADSHNWPLVREAYFKGAPLFVRRLIAPLLRRRITSGLIARDVLRAGESALWSEYSRVLDQLEARAPKQQFWISSEITIADIALFAMLHSLRTPLTAAQCAEIAKRPALSAWLDRVELATSVRTAPSIRRVA